MNSCAAATRAAVWISSRATTAWQEGARALASLLEDPNERERRGRAGIQRLGGTGVAVARRLLERLTPDRLSA